MPAIPVQIRTPRPARRRRSRRVRCRWNKGSTSSASDPRDKVRPELRSAIRVPSGTRTDAWGVLAGMAKWQTRTVEVRVPWGFKSPYLHQLLTIVEDVPAWCRIRFERGRRRRSRRGSIPSFSSTHMWRNLADAHDSGSCGKPCRFDSDLVHYASIRNTRVWWNGLHRTLKMSRRKKLAGSTPVTRTRTECHVVDSVCGQPCRSR